jgi:DNA-binding NarL/FixJ family response regulator
VLRESNVRSGERIKEMSTMLRVAIAEDQRLVVGMLKEFVERQPDMEVVGEARDGQEAVRVCQEDEPNVILMDIAMPQMDGISATRKIRKLCPKVSVLILSAYGSDENVFRGIKAGARGYLHKNCSPRELAEAIRTVHEGGTIMSPEIAERTLDIFGGYGGRSVNNSNGDLFPELTEREVEILRAVGQGKTNKEIAEKLYLSERTVRNHAYNIYRKLHLMDRTQATLYAIRQGLVDPHALGDNMS